MITESTNSTNPPPNERKNEVEKKVFAEKLRLLHKNLILSIPANFICATVVFISLYQIRADIYIIGWYLMVCAISVLRFVSFYFYQKNQHKDRIFLHIFILGVSISALLWGIADSLLMPQNNLMQQMIIIVIAAGVTAGGVQSLQGSLIANLLYVTLIVLPLTLWLLWQNTAAYLILGVAIGTYLLFMLITAKRGYELLSHELELQYQNLHLIENLSQTNKELEKAYKAEEEIQENLRTIVDNAPIGMAVISLKEEWIQANHSLTEIVGYSEEELSKLKLVDILDHTDYIIVQNHIQNLLLGKLTDNQFEVRFKHKHSQLVWIQLSTSLIRNQLGHPLYFIFQIQDISRRKHDEETMATLNKKTQMMFDEIKQREHEVSIINKMNDMLQICQSPEEAYSTIHFTAQELFPSFDGALIIFNKQNNLLETVKEWRENQHLKPTFRVEDCWSLRGGYPYVVNNPKQDILCQHFSDTPNRAYLCMPLMVQGGIIGILHLSSIKMDVMSEHLQQLATTFSEVVKLALANIKLRDTLHEQAIHDPLTGLFNRRFLNELLPNEIQLALRENSPLCVAMIDIDFFKQFNDKNGHDAGDEVLKFIGKTLKDRFYDNNIPCRFGGEEFLVILTHTDLTQAKMQLEKLRQAVDKVRLQFRDYELPQITLSVGIAGIPDNGKSANAIIRAADEALYQAKKSGRNQVIVSKASHTTYELK